MKLKTVLTITAVLFLLFGLGNLLVPGLMGEMDGITVTAAYILAARVLGAALLGLAIIIWSLRDATSSPLRNRLIIGITAFTGLAALLHLLGVIDGTMNSQGLGPTILLGLLTVSLMITSRPTFGFAKT
jgi:hypothetical protein